MLEVFQDLPEIADHLSGMLIVQYFEFDSEDHCYFHLHNCYPYINVKYNNQISINLHDLASGKLLHAFSEEKDFERGVVELTPPYKKITLIYKSGYKYVLILNKYD